jgi:hypothetical protein
MTVEDEPVLREEADRPRQHDPLDVASDLGEVVGAVVMRDPLDLLLDDGPLVEIARDEVRRGADQLTPRACAWWYGRAPLKPGRNE